jgi:hypothetical protein
MEESNEQKAIQANIFRCSEAATSPTSSQTAKSFNLESSKEIQEHTESFRGGNNKSSSSSQPMEISSVMVSLPFTMKARQQPMLAWKASMKALTGHPPLAISLFNPGKAEVFYDTALILSVRESLSAYLLNEAGVQERDLQRRKTMYFKGFFLPLRRAALQGFSVEAQHQLLDLAEKDLPRIPETDKRKQWKFHIFKDRSWLQQTSNQTQSSSV